MRFGRAVIDRYDIKATIVRYLAGYLFSDYTVSLSRSYGLPAGKVANGFIYFRKMPPASSLPLSANLLILSIQSECGFAILFEHFNG